MTEPLEQPVEEPVEEPETPLEGDLPDEPLVPDPEEPEEPEGGTEPPTASQPPSDDQLEKMSKAMDRAAKSYIDKAVTNLGDDLGGFTACPMCRDYWPGLRLPRMPEGETLEAIRVAIGEPTHPDYDADSWSHPCEKCHGYGVVATGSKVQGKGNVTCLQCDGLGYIADDDRRKGGSVTALQPVPAMPVYSEPAPAAPEPPEAEALRQLGYIVVAPVEAVS